MDSPVEPPEPLDESTSHHRLTVYGVPLDGRELALSLGVPLLILAPYPLLVGTGVDEFLHLVALGAWFVTRTYLQAQKTPDEMNLTITREALTLPGCFLPEADSKEDVTIPRERIRDMRVRTFRGRSGGTFRSSLELRLVDPEQSLSISFGSGDVTSIGKSLVRLLDLPSEEITSERYQIYIGLFATLALGALVWVGFQLF